MQYNRLHNKDAAENEENTTATTEKKQSSEQRLESMEREVTRLRDQQIKSKIHTRELEQRLKGLEEALKGLTEPKQPLASPFSFGTNQRLRPQLKKSNSDDLNYDHVILPKQTTGSRERIGLFGSLGASSQNR